MPNSWMLVSGENQVPQTFEPKSFIGGKPILPRAVDVPKCELCGVHQSFFCQVSFPDGHSWAGLTMAIFMCTSCVDEDHLIPEMLEEPLYGVDIPDGFLRRYQKNFRFVVFESALGEVKRDYVEKIVYKPLSLVPVDRPDMLGDKVGGQPNWILEDESPSTYAGKHKMCFLMQLMAETKFEIYEYAPAQMELGLTGKPQPSPSRYYQLFNGNAVFMFGVCGHAIPLVYALTQI